MIWTWFKDDWLVKRSAAKLFFASTLLVLTLIPLFLGKVDPSKMSLWARLPWGIAWTLAPIAVFFLWAGMWRYWVRIDNASKWAKRGWFFVLLIGLWWGSCLYCFFVYLPQVFRRTKVEA